MPQTPSFEPQFDETKVIEFAAKPSPEEAINSGLSDIFDHVEGINVKSIEVHLLPGNTGRATVELDVTSLPNFFANLDKHFTDPNGLRDIVRRQNEKQIFLNRLIAESQLEASREGKELDLSSITNARLLFVAINKVNQEFKEKGQQFLTIPDIVEVVGAQIDQDILQRIVDGEYNLRLEFNFNQTPLSSDWTQRLINGSKVINSQNNPNLGASGILDYRLRGQEGEMIFYLKYPKSRPLTTVSPEEMIEVTNDENLLSRIIKGLTDFNTIEGNPITVGDFFNRKNLSYDEDSKRFFVLNPVSVVQGMRNFATRLITDAGRLSELVSEIAIDSLVNLNNQQKRLIIDPLKAYSQNLTTKWREFSKQDQPQVSNVITLINELIQKIQTK